MQKFNNIFVYWVFLIIVFIDGNPLPETKGDFFLKLFEKIFFISCNLFHFLAS